MKKTSKLLILLVIILLAAVNGVQAMNHNLAWPWGDKCSPPQTPFLAFYSPQSKNMMFIDEKEIEVICQAGLRSVDLKWTLNRNMLKKPFMEGTAEPLIANKFKIKIPPEKLIPGFYDINVTLDTGIENNNQKGLDKRLVTGRCTFGWQVDKMAIRETRPKDFKEFWAQAKKEIDAVPLDVKFETEMKTYNKKEIDEYNIKSACLPKDYDPQGHKFEEVESCKVSFAGPEGGRVYGWLAKPKGEGPFPVMLVLPGAGFAARSQPLEHARHGYLALDIQIHGQDVDLTGKYPQIPGYNEDWVFDPINKYYFYNVHKRVMQAVNYLLSRPDIDKSRVVAVGGSQGGRLGIVIAGLDPRITAVVSCIANSPNYPHLHWAANCNGLHKPWDRPWKVVDYKFRPLQDGMDLKGAPPEVTDPDGKCFAYYDPMNFAPDIKCPVLMNGGLIDPVSPPYSVYAVYNRLPGNNKEIIPIAGHGHDWSCYFDRYAWKWLEKMFKK